MFSLLNNIVVLLFLILVIQPSTSSPLENDKLAQLIERLDSIQTKMDAMRSRESVLVVENAQLTERLDRMQTKMDAIQSRVEVLEVENDKWIRKFGDLEAEHDKLKSQISHPKFSPSTALKQDDGPSSRLLTSPPTSCQELKNNNGLWPMDGIHLLKKNDKIQAAFCRFAADGSPVSETLIGKIDVKTKTVHFYVQRISPFSTPQAIIPFDLAILNEGNAFDLPSGVFTAPVTGIYHFELSAVKDRSIQHLYIFLQVNGNMVGLAVNHQSTTGSLDAVSLSASFRLGAGNKVNLVNYSNGVVYENGDHTIHFTGWLVEEDMV